MAKSPKKPKKPKKVPVPIPKMPPELVPPPPKTPAVMGRPTKYKPEYCQQLVTFMAGGPGFEAFAGEIGVNIDTLHEWVKQHGDFSEAKKEAFGKNRLFWERISIGGMTGLIPNFNATVWVFSMKNRFGWRDKQDIVASVSIGDKFDRMTDEELDEYIRTGVLPARKDDL